MALAFVLESTYTEAQEGRGLLYKSLNRSEELSLTVSKQEQSLADVREQRRLTAVLPLLLDQVAEATDCIQNATDI